MIRLYDTVLRRVVEPELREPGKLSMYVCGPTVYDVPHLGHGRAVMVYDVLRRYLEWSGVEVVHVSNVTDIDDNIINRAAEKGWEADELARHYEEVWWDALDRLGVARPHHAPRATEYVDQMVELVARLVEEGKAYAAVDGVYFDVSTVPDYGLLALQPLDSLRSGARVEVDEQKRGERDFALWKLSKPGEPAWPSPWGDGRPGWHTECVVMSLDLLGDDFDLHTGGLDLVFPHHENERAQAIAGGRKFSRRWMHHAFIEVDGEKMSKSIGNFTTLVDLLDVSDARAYRMLVLQSHYRSPVEVNPVTVEKAVGALGRLDDFARRVDRLPAGTPDEDALRQFVHRMDDDLDTVAALAGLFDTLRRANTALDGGDTAAAASLSAAVMDMAAALGLIIGAGEEVPNNVSDLITERQAARTARDFAGADAIRDRLAALGWAVEDTPSGPKARRL